MSFFGELRRRNVFRVAVAYTVAAWLVAQVAELALDSFGTPAWVMKTILLVLALGLPFAVIFAWAYEMTPGGLKREKDVDRSQSITPQTSRKLNYTIIGVLAVALVLSIATRGMQFGSDEPAEPIAAEENVEKSIAVLPFVNMSDEKENEYFSDGISEELLNVLVKVEGLRVASRTSSFSFKGKDTPIPEIAGALKVEHILEGSVRKAGDTIRITAQLIDVKTDSHLWSETYDRKFEDIFVIQDEISAHIVEALRIALGAGEITSTFNPKRTDDLDAYQDYLRGRHFWQRRGGDNIRMAIELFQKATAADPGFARAWAALSSAHLTMPTYSDEPDEEHHKLALEYARKALDLDPLIAEPHAVMGDLLRFERRWGEAEEHYLKAIELEPKNSTPLLWYAEQLTATGRREAALATALKALELDPFHPGTNSVASTAYAMNNQIERAIALGRSAWDVGHRDSIYWVIRLQVFRGNFIEATQLIDSNLEFFTGEEAETLQLFAAAAEDPGQVDHYLAALPTIWDTQGPEFWYALEHFHFGRPDKGMAIALQSDIDGGWWMDAWLPDTRALREHPQFGELLEANGLVDFWDEFGWPSQCRRAGDRISCD